MRRQVFADLKNDFVFRRIFATHLDILRGLLNDLLERTGDQQIVSIEYLPSEQLPHVEGAKLSILDVRCKDIAGRIFIVEMQLIHVDGFVNRVVYNGCKAYVNQLKSGDPYKNLVDVVAISICNFELWPNSMQEAKKEPRVPMLSHYSMHERSSGNKALLQVQYAFLELPKVPKEQPAGGAELWAWLFVHAPELLEVPVDLPVGPMREAMELAKEASLSDLELEAYHKVASEISQATQLVEDKLKEGRKEGRMEGKREMLLRVLQKVGIKLTDSENEQITICKDPATLERWFDNALGAKRAADVFA